MNGYSGGNGGRAEATSLVQPRRHMDSGAKIEAILYAAAVPEQFFPRLTEALRPRSNRTLEATIPLYTRIREYPGLSEKDAIRLLPILATREVARLVREGDQEKVDRYIKEMAQWYLETTNVEVAKPGVIRDRHQGRGRMVHGSTDSPIIYGRNVDYRYAGKDRAAKVPSVAHVKKVERLAKAINSQNWNYATEIHRDLTGFPGHLFGTEARYRQFLVDAESIILQESGAHKVVIVTQENFGYPIGYEILTPAQYAAHMGKNGYSSSARAIQAARRAGRLANRRPEPRSRGVMMSVLERRKSPPKATIRPIEKIVRTSSLSASFNTPSFR